MGLNQFPKQKILYFLWRIFILIAEIFAVNALIAGTKHSQAEILIDTKGYKMTSQGAIDEGGFSYFLLKNFKRIRNCVEHRT
ncbi:hypothetical protein CMI42_05710 [Candidatus Pacearchaeota archaeon]|nr:hypothetical protein [Candidatus Pacearchaeota archaeon]